MRRAWRWLPSLLWMGVIYYLSDQSGEELGRMFPFIPDFNWGHLVAYFILAVLLCFGFWPMNRRAKYLGAFFISVMYGVTDEFHQAFVPGRHPDPFDLLTDAVGTLLGLWVVKAVGKNS